MVSRDVQKKAVEFAMSDNTPKKLAETDGEELRRRGRGFIKAGRALLRAADALEGIGLDQGKAKGGYARAASLTVEQRREIGRMGAKARWERHVKDGTQ